MTFQALFDEIKELHDVEVTMVACGRIALYNAYMPGNKHVPRLAMLPEKLYVDTAQEEFPASRNYMILELGGETCDDGSDFSMPPVKYYFR
jgi:hypothetical protein